MYEDAFKETSHYKDLASRKDVLEAKIISRHALIETKRLLAGKTEENIIKAQALLAQVEKVIGPTAETQNGLKEADEQLWQLASEQITAAINKNDFDSARRALERYLELSEAKAHRAEAMNTKEALLRREDDALFSAAVEKANTHLQRKEYDLARNSFDQYLALSTLKVHKTEALANKDKVRDIEDDNDWTTVSASAEQNLSQRTFKQASLDYENYLKRWPTGRHAADARRGLEKVMPSHFQYLRQFTAYDEFYEEFQKVCDLYPSAHEHIKVAKRSLVFHVHNEIGRLYGQVTRKSLLPASAADKMGQIKYNQCDPDNKSYLDKLADVFRNYLNTPNIYNTNCFLWYFQRPPKDCVKMNNEPTVFWISIDRVDVSMADSTYARIKGTMGFDADPKIRINYRKDTESTIYPIITEVFSGLGAVNQRTFSVRPTESLFFEKGAEVLDTALDDNDTTGDSNILWVFWRNLQAGESQSSRCDFKDGSSITINYTLK